MSLVIVTCNGKALAGWVEVDVHQAFEKCAGEAKVKATELDGPIPMNIGDFAQVLIDGTPVITGYVHEVDGEYNKRSHYINATVRDQTQDLIDSTVGPKLKVKSPITLHQLAQKTIGVMGLNIPVIDKVSPPPFEQGEHISAAIDDPGFGFLDQYAQKRQVLFNTDGRGSLVINRNQGQRAPAMLHSGTQDDPLNNVLESHYRNSDLNRHNSHSVNGQKSHGDKSFWESKPKGFAQGQADPMQKNWGVGNDQYVRPQRRRHIRGAKGLSNTSPKKAGQWHANVQKARGFQYTATVQGFHANGWLWWPGYIVPVFDAHWLLSAELLIKEVKFKKSWHGGETTEISCTYPDAYTDGSGSGGTGGGGGRTSQLGQGAGGTFPADGGNF